MDGGIPTTSFFDLFSRLDLLGKKKLVVCPESEFHEYELLPTEFFESLRTTYSLLSYGVSFYDTDTILRWHIMEAFEQWLHGDSPQRSKYFKDDFLHGGDRTDWTDHIRISSNRKRDEEFVDILREERNKKGQGLQSIFERWKTEDDKEFVDWFKDECWGIEQAYIEKILLS